jgi:hypothetical protein
MTGDEWAAQEHRAMLALAAQVRTTHTADCQCRDDSAYNTELDLTDCE